MVPFSSLFQEGKLPTPECMVVVDSGFSSTNVVPIMNGEIIWHAVKRSVPNSGFGSTILILRRIDVGGKILTNHLKELVSYRQWNMMDETYIMNDVKEQSCYVSTDLRRDLDICRYLYLNSISSVGLTKFNQAK